MTNPMGIAVHRSSIVSGNRLLVADDSNNSRVATIKFTPLTIGSFGGPGQVDGQFMNPKDVKVHYSSGNIFVADTGNSRIQKYTRSTGPITSWHVKTIAVPGTSDGKFDQPVVMAVDPSTSDLYVSDKNNNRIQKLTSAGVFITKYDGKWATGMAVDSQGNVYLSFSNRHKIYKFTSDFTPITEWGSFGSANNQFNHPLGIAIDYMNNVYVVDQGNFRIQKFDKDNNHLLTFGGVGSGIGKFKAPYGIAFDGSTNSVHVSDFGKNVIQTFTQNGSAILMTSIP